MAALRTKVVEIAELLALQSPFIWTPAIWSLGSGQNNQERLADIGSVAPLDGSSKD